MTRIAVLLCLAPLTGLAGCGLHPLYAGGASGPVASTLARVDVAPIEGKAGYLMADALHQRFIERAGETPLYRLEIKLEDKITGLGVRTDDSVTRERRALRARFQLVSLDKGTVVLDATAGSDEGIDVVGSEYATIAAEDTALERLTGIVADQIVARLSLFARRDAAATR